VPLGLAAGFVGGWSDRVVTWVADLGLALPAIILILVVLSIFPQSMLAGMVTLGVLNAPGLMRVVRSTVLPVKEELYIAAAQVSGLSRVYIVGRHVLPRIAGPVIVLASLLAAAALLVQTGLAFLGVLVAPPAPSWGGMVADGATAMVLQPWLIWPPGVVITLTVLALGLLGDVVRDASTEIWAAPAGRRAPKARSEAVLALAEPVSDVLLAVEGLHVAFASPRGGELRVVQDVTFDIRAGQAVGLVGESGCGKSATAMSIPGLLPGTGHIQSGRILFDGVDLASLPESRLRGVRGKKIGVISQEPLIGLNPAFRVGWQLEEVVRRHHPLSRREVRRRVVELLASVHLPDPAAVAGRYPHELSGGMAQRVAIARALAGEPKLLIADEPTTALDVTVQGDILELLRELQRDRQMAILLVTHDWGVVADICDHAVVMYAGEVVERAEVTAMFTAPLHPYTEALLASNPHNAPEEAALPSIPGVVPQPARWPAGCHFHPRCGYATAACSADPVPLVRPAREHETRCIHYQELQR
jgi:peptide/nickel transport system permease protein